MLFARGLHNSKHHIHVQGKRREGAVQWALFPYPWQKALRRLPLSVRQNWVMCLPLRSKGGQENENLVFLDLYRRCQRERGIKNAFMLPIDSVCHISQQSFDSYLVNEITTSLKFKNSKHSVCSIYFHLFLPKSLESSIPFQMPHFFFSIG